MQILGGQLPICKSFLDHKNIIFSPYLGQTNFRNKIPFQGFLDLVIIQSFLERNLGLFRLFFWAHENNLHWKMRTEKWKWHTGLQCLLHLKSFRYALPPSRDYIWRLLELYILLLSFYTNRFFVCNFKQSNEMCIII